MLSLATWRSKRPSAQPPDPNIRLGFGNVGCQRLTTSVAMGEEQTWLDRPLVPPRSRKTRKRTMAKHMSHHFSRAN